MVSSLNLEEVRPRRHRDEGHGVHPYFGKVDPALARILIETLCESRSCVLDPFCGSGTVVHEALLAGRSAIGWDSSPLAIRIAAAKVAGITHEEHAALERLRNDLIPYGSQEGLFGRRIPEPDELPSMPRVTDFRSWFGPNALKELAFLRAAVRNLEDQVPPAVMLLATVAFSRIIVAASLQQGESTYRRVPKPDLPGRVIALFSDALGKVITSARAFQAAAIRSGLRARELVINEDQIRIDWANVSAELTRCDTREAVTSAPMADLVVSSPPYLMSWDYGLYHKFRFYWLGWDLNAYEETEIGRHLRRRNDDVERYSTDMAAAFAAMNTALRPAARIALVNAPSIVYGKRVDTNEILAGCGRRAGWQLEQLTPSLGIPGPHHGMYESLRSRGANAPGSRGKREHVLLFTRAQR